MNEKINMDLKSLKFILNKNKAYIFPVVIILVSILLFFQFVIPQFNLFFQTQEDVKDLKAKTAVLKENLNVLNNIDEGVLGSQFETMSSALPLSKDFMGILNSINTAAQKAGVSLGNFSFKIGSLSSSENNTDVFPVVKFTVPIDAGVAGANSFVQAISTAFPLAQVDSISINSTTSTVNLSFYYKLLNISTYNQYIPISPVSQKGLTLIDQMNGFESASSFSLPSLPVTPVASTSAVH